MRGRAVPLVDDGGNRLGTTSVGPTLNQFRVSSESIQSEVTERLNLVGRKRGMPLYQAEP